MSSEQDAIDQFAMWLDHALQIDDLELLTLKGHVIVEDALKYLLASRLGVDPVTFRTTIQLRSFPLLVQLAFAGDEKNQDLVEAIRTLNSARTKASHWMADPRFSDDVQRFVRQMFAIHGQPFSWPAQPAAQLESIRKALDWTASQIFVIAVGFR